MPRWKGEWADGVRRAERWLLPSECLACGTAESMPDDALVCSLCRLRWRPLAPPTCPRCSEPLHLGLACRVCTEWPTDFGPVTSAVMLDPAVRRLVHRFKYHGWSRLADSFGLSMAPLVANADADLVPIPLGRRRQRARGYNQAAVLAQAVSQRTGLRVRPERLMRIRETGTQTRLAPEARRANLAAAFVALGSRRPAVLVDDVFTTGATLVSAASVLLEAGAPSVTAVTFARALPPLTGAATRLGRFRTFPEE